MPELREAIFTPQPVNQVLSLPSSFPLLPDAIRKRFGFEADEYNEQTQRWWSNAKRTLSESHFETTEPINQVKQDLQTLSASFTSVEGTFSAFINEERNARIEADGAIATRTLTLESQVQTPVTGLLARIQTVETTYATTTAVGAAISSAISAEVTNRNTAISNSASVITSAYASADSALNTSLSGSISAVSATVTANNNTLTAAVSAETTARAAADGNLSGKYSLKVVAGNVVTGMNITSSSGGGTDVSDVTFQAGSFKIYNGTSGIAPFQVIGGQVRVQNLAIVSSDVSGLAATATSSDYSAVTGTKPPPGADVTLTAMSGGLTITSGGVTLAGSALIQSSNYVASSSGWAIKPDGTVEFNNGTFRGTVDIGSGINRAIVQSGQISLGAITMASSGGVTPITVLTIGQTLGRFELTGYSTTLESQIQGYNISGTLKLQISANGSIRMTSISDVNNNQVVGTRQTAPTTATPTYTPTGTYTSDIASFQTTFGNHATVINSIRTALIAHGLIG